MLYLFYFFLLATFNLHSTENKTYLRTMQTMARLLMHQDVFPDAFNEDPQDITLNAAPPANGDAKQPTRFAHDDMALLGLRTLKERGSDVYLDLLESQFDHLDGKLRKNTRQGINNDATKKTRHDFAWLLRERMYRAERFPLDQRKKASRSMHSLAAHKEQIWLQLIKARHTASEAWANKKLGKLG